ncbi:MAG: 2-succinyl-5-enolpyruvyl-6-hydroxy-3-cyclohexene-1-carboxylic-acid synthase, partial [Actinomycetota bacterium]
MDGIRASEGIDPLVDPGTLATAAPEDVQATFCSVMVDTWIGLGSTMAFVAPGSRSTPLALALMSDSRMRVDVLHDERSVAFAALGYGVATGRPAVAVCTSGTAAAHFHAAVVEADLSGVPLLVCTADRPPELRDVGAPQTIDQTKLFGSTTRWFHDPGVPSAAAAPTWRSLAARAVAATCGLDPGPVHVNLPFREPLVGRSLVASGAGASRRHEIGRPILDGDLVEGLAHSLRSARSGLIVAGRGCGDPDAVARLAQSVGWPVIADPRSGCQGSAAAVVHADAVLRVPDFADRIRPDLVVRLGESPSSKVVNQWIAASGAEEWHISERPAVYDPHHRIVRHVIADVSDLCRRLAVSQPTELAEDSKMWFAADAAARAALS